MGLPRHANDTYRQRYLPHKMYLSCTAEMGEIIFRNWRALEQSSDSPCLRAGRVRGWSQSGAESPEAGGRGPREGPHQRKPRLRRSRASRPRGRRPESPDRSQRTSWGSESGPRDPAILGLCTDSVAVASWQRRARCCWPRCSGSLPKP